MRLFEKLLMLAVALSVVLLMYLAYQESEKHWELFIKDIVAFSSDGNQLGWTYEGSFKTANDCINAGLKTVLQEYVCTTSSSYEPK